MENRFVNRAQEMTRLGEELKPMAVVTVLGSPGMGKTRLASEYVRQLCRGPGILWIDLEHRDLGELKHAGERNLVVLDGCHHRIRDVVAAIGERSPTPVLATSREILGVDGEHVIALGPLRSPPRGSPVSEAMTSTAMQLLDARMFEAGAGGIPPEHLLTASSLVRRVGGLPQAIECVAVPAARLGIERVFEEIDARFAALEAVGRRIVRTTILEVVSEWAA